MNVDIEAMKSHLINLAEDQTMYDGREEWDCDIGDRCGGNFDDAYNRGNSDGYTDLARELLRKYFNLEACYTDD